MCAADAPSTVLGQVRAASPLRPPFPAPSFSLGSLCQPLLLVSLSALLSLGLPASLFCIPCLAFLPFPPLFHLSPHPTPSSRARNAAEAVTSPGGSPDPWCPGPVPRAPRARSSRVRRGLSGRAGAAGSSCGHGGPRSNAGDVWPPGRTFRRPRPPPRGQPAFQASAGLGVSWSAAPSAAVSQAAALASLSRALLPSAQAQGCSRGPSASGGALGEGLSSISAPLRAGT